MPRRALAFVLVICAAARATLAFGLSHAFISQDTPLYLLVADALRTGDWRHYQGERTPGYPLLLLLGLEQPTLVWALQALLGLLTVALLFWLMWAETGRERAAVWGSLAWGLLPTTLLFEASLMTETLATFLVLLGFVLAQRACAWRGGVLLGMACGLAALTRPVLAALIPVYLLWLLGKHRRARLGAAFVATALAPVLLWCAVNGATTGYFTLTTLTGFHLTDHTGAWMELAPPGVLPDLYLQARHEVVAATGGHANTIWRALPAMEQVTGLSRPALSARWLDLSVDLIRRAPDRYLGSMARAWLWFWRPAPADAVIDPAGFDPRPLSGLIVLDWLAQGGLHLAFALALCWRGLARSRCRGGGLAIALVLVASISQAPLEWGSNARFLLPFQPSWC